MHRTSAAALLLLPLLAAACASPAPLDQPPADSCGPIAAECVPAFSADGRLLRDLETGAPLYRAGSAALAGRAPRFDPDGTVARDPATGVPLYDEISGPCVVRVLLPAH